MRRRWLLLLGVLAFGAAPARAIAQEARDPKACEPLRGDLADSFGMAVEAEPETMDDARTARTLPGCRITAAGGTGVDMVATAELLYDQLGAIGWTHTPDPRDVPSKHILRLRRDGSDCLFGVYTLIEGSAATAAQRRVNQAFKPVAQDERYNVIATCVPALETSP
jgi:hypothetical protein